MGLRWVFLYKCWFLSPMLGAILGPPQDAPLRKWSPSHELVKRILWERFIQIYLFVMSRGELRQVAKNTIKCHLHEIQNPMN